MHARGFVPGPLHVLGVKTRRCGTVFGLRVELGRLPERSPPDFAVLALASGNAFELERRIARPARLQIGNRELARRIGDQCVIGRSRRSPSTTMSTRSLKNATLSRISDASRSGSR